MTALILAQTELEAAAAVPSGLTFFSFVPIQAHLSSVQAELADAAARFKVRRFSTYVVALTVYLFGGLAIFLSVTGVLTVDESAAQLNQEVFLGIPVPVCVWAGIGLLHQCYSVPAGRLSQIETTRSVG